MKSKLTKKILKTNNHSNGRSGQKITKITPHHMAGNLTGEQIQRVFNSRRSSANYSIDNEGVITLHVDEENRAWTSSSKWNDDRAITIEVANSTGAPNWEISDKAQRSLINLMIDICKRYDIYPEYNGTKDGTITTHRMFSRTMCPGPYILSNMNYIVSEVRNGLLTEEEKQDKLYKVQMGAFKNKGNAQRLSQKLKQDGYDTYIKEE